MYAILVIVTSKCKITTLLVFLRKWALKDKKCIMSEIVTERYYCMTVNFYIFLKFPMTVNFILFYLFPTTSDRLRICSQVFSNEFIAVWLLTEILACAVCCNTWHPTTLFFPSDNKNHKVSSILPFRHSSAGDCYIGKPVLKTLFLFLTFKQKFCKKC